MVFNLKLVDRFHKAFGVYKETPKKATLVDEKEYLLRYKLMDEENEEYLAACKSDDLVEIADALGDKLYVLCGTILKHGLHHKIDEVFDEIHDSNMSKLDAKGNPILRKDGKVMKSNLYFRPNIKKILEK